MKPEVQRYIALAGRILLAAIFIHAGYGKFTHWEMTAGYMAKAGMPLVPFFLACAATLELGGGILLLTPFGARYAAAALFLFLIPTTLIFHPFWKSTGMEAMQQQGHFMANVAIMGGLLNVSAFGAGPRDSEDSR